MNAVRTTAREVEEWGLLSLIFLWAENGGPYPPAACRFSVNCLNVKICHSTQFLYLLHHSLVMIASVQRSSLSGEVYAPPSKSYTHRAILITSLGPGGSVKRALLSADTRATVSASQAFGAEISLDDDNGEVRINGVCNRPRTPEDVINVLNSGTTLRFCSAVAALTDGAVLTGDASIRTRPNGPLLSAISELKAQAFSIRNNDRAPLVIR
ncbi:MAG: hypothetical protein PHF80_04465, partial [Methanothrix sp.]|nr:hypothetical protein [Methanothrix sp.]